MTLIMISISSAALSESGGLKEIPDVRFVIDGRPVTLTDVPLSLNNRTMLPLRALLVSLGVPDDEEHISWNGNDSSVTVSYEGRSIYLKLDSKTAYIDGKAVEMDIAPTGYAKNQRIYLPVKFIANAMGKEAAWDGYTKTVYIRNAEAFEETRSRLEKTEAAMEAVVKADINTAMKLLIGKENAQTEINVAINEKLDRSQNFLSSDVTIPVSDTPMIFRTYYSDNAEFSMGPADTDWDKKPLAEDEFKRILNESMSLISINNLDVLSAVLEAGEGERPGELTLKGDVYPRGLAENLAVYAGLKALKADGYSLEAVVDRDSGMVRNIKLRLTGKFDAQKESKDFAAEIVITYSGIYP